MRVTEEQPVIQHPRYPSLGQEEPSLKSLSSLLQTRDKGHKNPKSQAGA